MSIWLSIRSATAAAALAFLAATAGAITDASPIRHGLAAEPADGPPPAPPATQRKLIGEYGEAEGDFTIFQQGGVLLAKTRAGGPNRLAGAGPGRFRISGSGEASVLKLVRQGIVVDGRLLRKRDFGAEATKRVRAAVRSDPKRLRKEAMAATPPGEIHSARASDLVSLEHAVPGLRLDIRYATTDNFMGIKLYERPAAYLQRPAAEALARVAERLRRRGYGLVIYDAYRPWFVTKMFWEATPVSNRAFVADPSKGSRHNRGCAVDLGLVDLRTGKIVEMPSRYDEFSARAHANFPGGTDRQRWHRDLLRRAMELEGFTVLPEEWWHFDYKDWLEYPIGNFSFSQLDGS